MGKYDVEACCVLLTKMVKQAARDCKRGNCHAYGAEAFLKSEGLAYLVTLASPGADVDAVMSRLAALAHPNGGNGNGTE